MFGIIFFVLYVFREYYVRDMMSVPQSQYIIGNHCQGA